jgi:hypothetical protein
MQVVVKKRNAIKGRQGTAKERRSGVRWLASHGSCHFTFPWRAEKKTNGVDRELTRKKRAELEKARNNMEKREREGERERRTGNLKRRTCRK